MNKRELLNTAYGLHCLKKEEKFYQFAKKYLSSNDGSEDDISAWCKLILTNSSLKQLDKNELAYVMGYCARIAKIKEIEK